MVYHDSFHKTLEDYPRPSVAVDTAVLTVPPGGELAVVIVSNRLPGTFIHPGERLSDAVLRSLREKAGIEGLRPRQLLVFDDPDRDPRGWVISVAHADAIPTRRLNPNRSHYLLPVAGLDKLDYAHNEIVELAVAELRADYAAAPDPAQLLEEPFTLRELHTLHEAVAGEPLQRDTFRRAMLPMLTATGERSTGSMGKPAELYRRG